MAPIATHAELFALLRQDRFRLEYAQDCWTRLTMGTAGNLPPAPGNGCQITIRQHGTDESLCVPKLYMLFSDRSVQELEIPPFGRGHSSQAESVARTAANLGGGPREAGYVTVTNRVENSTMPEMLAGHIAPEPKVRLLYLMLTLRRTDPSTALPPDYSVDLEVRGAPFGITEDNRHYGASAPGLVPLNDGEYTALGVLLSPEPGKPWCAVCVPPLRRVEIAQPEPTADGDTSTSEAEAAQAVTLLATEV